MAALAVGVAAALTLAAAVSEIGFADFKPVGGSGGSLPGLPSGGHVWSLAFAPVHQQLTYAGTDNGVYSSIDGGFHWQQSGLQGVTVWQVGFAADGRTMFAATETRGLLRSTDGSTWTGSNTGLLANDVRSIGFGVAGMALGTNQGVWMSADNGLHWHAAGLGKLHISSVVVSANAPKFTVIAGADGGDIANTGFLLRSDDGGAAWQLLQSGLTAADRTVVSGLAVGPLPQSALARPLVAVTSQGTFHSEDGGITWGQAQGIPTDPAPIVPTTVAFSATNPGLVYVGADSGGSSGGDLLRSTDGGQHFATADGGLDPLHREVGAIAMTGAAPPAVLVALDPIGQVPVLYTEIDASVPSPAAIATEPGATAPPTLPAVKPTPVPRPVIAPATVPPPGDSESPGLLRRMLGLPFPLAVELIVILGLVWLVMRWRRNRMEIEGPF